MYIYIYIYIYIFIFIYIYITYVRFVFSSDIVLTIQRYSRSCSVKLSKLS